MAEIQPRIYTKKDYEGELNLKVAEKFLILKAAKKFNNNKRKMARALDISTRALDYKLISHGLEL
jgi:DNA-binding NtrC family response regulator